MILVEKNNNQRYLQSPLSTAVLFLVFNRPDTTRQVFNAIRQAKPPRLYIGADGPRKNKKGEYQLCNEVRKIATDIDWNCEVYTLFRKENLGCRKAVSSAIDWFFINENQGIIHEYDCLPSKSFFKYCQELLIKYADNKDIFLISGHNKQNQWNYDQFDYFFSDFGGIWGWASWRRAWHLFDLEMNDLDQFSQSGGFEKILGASLGARRKRELTLAKFKIEIGTMDSWAYPWAFTRHIHAAKSCVPSLNQIVNIGIGKNATHTRLKPKYHVELHEIKFPLRHNATLVSDHMYDDLYLPESRYGMKLINILLNFRRFLYE